MRKEDYLAHYGVKGMKWGVRRYQPYPSKASRRRRVLTGNRVNKEAVRASMNKARDVTDASLTRSIKTKNGVRVSPAEQGISNAQKINNEAINVTRYMSDAKRRKTDVDTSDMTDAELRAAVNRMNLERQYRTLTAENTRTGYEKALEILQTSGALIGVASGVVGIAVGIHQLRGK